MAWIKVNFGVNGHLLGVFWSDFVVVSLFIYILHTTIATLKCHTQAITSVSIKAFVVVSFLIILAIDMFNDMRA